MKHVFSFILKSSQNKIKRKYLTYYIEIVSSVFNNKHDYGCYCHDTQDDGSMKQK